MHWEAYEKPAFSVIGKEGSTREDAQIASLLWQRANEAFAQVAPLAKRDAQGNTAVWGLMSDFSRSFAPWEEEFTQGLYLAGVEVDDGAQPPEGWVKWNVPGFAYAGTPMEDETTFSAALSLLLGQGHTLAGAVQERFEPHSGKVMLLFPVRRL